MKFVTVLTFVLSVAGCTQTMTNADGERESVAVSPVLVGFDRLRADFSDQLIETGRVPERYQNRIGIGDVTGFDGPGFSGMGPTIRNPRAKVFYEGSLRDAGSALGDTFILDVALLEPPFSPALGAVTATANIRYTLRTSDNQIVFSETIRSPFTVSFAAAPVGRLRGVIAFTGSLHNNFALLLQALR